MGRIPEDIIRQVLEHSDIVDVVASYVPLKRAGRNYKALSPFQHEKTPSFMVSPEKQIFHCFSSGVGGNVVSFVMKMERLPFPEAIRFLADRCGIVVPEETDNQPGLQEKVRRREKLWDIHRSAAEFFHRQLLNAPTPAAKSAVAYLKQRGVTLEMVQTFQLGFAPEAWDGLLRSLTEEGVPPQLVEQAGLAIARRQNDGYYDRFRNRVMFPISDSRGRCVAFGGRALDADNPAKYLNSPETEIYTKGRFLYGFHLARESIGKDDAVLIVEGYMDFITVFQAGVKNVVASLGTALTLDQIRLLRRYTQNVVLLFDADQAGEAAMMRSLDTLLAEDMHVRIVGLLRDEDPDSFIRNKGIAAFRQRLEQTESLLDFKMRYLQQRYPGHDIESRAQICAEIVPTLQKIRNRIIQSEYIRQVAQQLHITEQSLLAEFQRLSDKRESSRPASEKPPGSNQKVRHEAIRPVERDLVCLMLEDPTIITQVKAEVRPEDFRHELIRLVVRRLLERQEQGLPVNASSLIQEFADTPAGLLVSQLLLQDDVLIGEKSKILRDCLRRIKDERLALQRRRMLTEIEQAQREGDAKTLEALTHEFQRLVKCQT